MSDEVVVKVFANGKWHPMPMTSADAARLICERDEAVEEVARLQAALDIIMREIEIYKLSR